MTEYIVNPEEEQHLFYGRKYEELIRCKECKYHTAYHECTNEHWDSPDYPVVDDSDYCSRAERKEE